ncbi:MAG: hypothetical protein WBB31_05765 [Saprospiraceae bacterium]
MKTNTVIIIPVSILFFLSHFISAQNVGIGTITPVEKLDVDGNVKADTLKPNALQLLLNAGTGKILTSDVTGNASWESLILAPPANPSGNVGYGVWGDCGTNGNIAAYQPMADTAANEADTYGGTVSISSNFAIVGSNTDDETFQNQGSVTFYQFNGSTWQLLEKLTDPDAGANDVFGTSVSISGAYAIVGAPFDSDIFSQQGSASIYQFNGSNWQLMQKITDPDGQTGYQFGFSVSISGDYAIIGAPMQMMEGHFLQGSASIYYYDGSTWTLMDKVTNPSGAAADNFGYAVAISNGYAIIGAINDDESHENQGSASIFQFNGSNWVLMNKVLDATSGFNDNFGYSVSISGQYAIVGSIYDDINYSNQGSASIYHYNGTNWVMMQKISELVGGDEDNFGTCVALCGPYALVGSARDDVGTNNSQGSASLFQRIGSCWQQMQLITDPAGVSPDLFGTSCALDCTTKRFLIGARGFQNSRGKVVFGKIN